MQLGAVSRGLDTAMGSWLTTSTAAPASLPEVKASAKACSSSRPPRAKTMQSKKVEGLRFCGEVLDVDAFTGGFNMQIAFATGYLAGNTID